MAVVYALMVGLFIHRELNWRKIWLALVSSARGTAVIMIILGGAQVVSWFLAYEQAPQRIAEWMLGSIGSPIVFLLLVNVLLLLVGTFMENGPSLVLLCPVLYPVAAKFGILIKDAQALEVAHTVNVVAFDKTGTLTVGQPRLTALVPVGLTNDEALALAAGLQSGSEHPLARAVLQAAKDKALTVPAPIDVQAVAGRGTQGKVGERTLLMGSLRWMGELGVDLAPVAAQATDLQAGGATVSAMAEQQAGGVKLLALLAFADEPKPGAKEALATLKARGIQTVMISGDNRGAAEAMAKRLGLDAKDVLAEVLPGDKAAKVAALKAGGKVVAMVGDGVNDAPALAAADVGMAMANPNGGGTDVAMHAAGITLMRGDPLLVAAALDISRRTVAKIRQNLFWAFAYNAAGIPLAALGYLSPVVAGAAMALSSVSVMTNALLLKRWTPEKGGK